MHKIIVIIGIILLYTCDDNSTNPSESTYNFNFTDWKTVSGTWSYSDDVLMQLSNGQPNSQLGYQISTGDTTWKNYTVSFDVKSESMNWVGLFFRYTNQYNFYLFLLRNGGCELGSNSGISRNYSVLKTYTSTMTTDTWYSVLAHINENHFQLYVNNVLYFDQTSDLFKSGSIALGGKDASYFKNIKVLRE